MSHRRAISCTGIIDYFGLQLPLGNFLAERIRQRIPIIFLVLPGSIIGTGQLVRITFGHFCSSWHRAEVHTIYGTTSDWKPQEYPPAPHQPGFISRKTPISVHRLRLISSHPKRGESALRQSLCSSKGPKIRSFLISGHNVILVGGFARYKLARYLSSKTLICCRPPA